MERDRQFKQLLAQHFDTTLQELQRRVARQRKMSAMLGEMLPRRQALLAQVQELESTMLRQQADVEKFEGGSLAAFFYLVTGRKDEKLARERAEACAARLEYDAARAELTALQQDISRYEEELAALSGCGEEYARMLAEKAAALKASGSQNGQELLDMESRIAQLQLRIREIGEARSAGGPVRETLKEITEGLEEARKRYTAYTLARPRHPFYEGMLEWLDYVQECAHRLQGQLRRFEAELADLQLPFSAVTADYTPPRSGGFVRVGVLIASDTMDFLNDSIRHARGTDGDVSTMLEKLEALEQNAQAELDELCSRRRALIEQSRIFQTGD